MTRLLTVALMAAATSAISLRADEDQLKLPTDNTPVTPPLPPVIPDATPAVVEPAEQSVSKLERGREVDGYSNLEFFNGLGSDHPYGPFVVTYKEAKEHCEKRGVEEGRKGRLAVQPDKSVRDDVQAAVAKYMPKGTFRKYWVGFTGEGAKSGPEKKEGEGTKKGFGSWKWADGTDVSIEGDIDKDIKDYAQWHQQGKKIKGKCGQVMFNQLLNATNCGWEGNFLCEYYDDPEEEAPAAEEKKENDAAVV